MIDAPRKRRNRARKPAWRFSGMTLAEWQGLPEYVQWAQTSPQYRDLLTVLINERRRILDFPAITENRALGRVEGYEEALRVLIALAEGATPEIAPDATPTYENNDDTDITTD